MIGSIFIALFCAAILTWLVMILYVLIWTLGSIVAFIWDGMKMAAFGIYALFQTFMKADLP